MLNRKKWNKKQIISSLLMAFFIITGSCAQNQCTPLEYIIGKWKCVKVRTGKTDLYNPIEIKSSILNIEKQKLYYTEGKFKASCKFQKWVIDTSTDALEDIQKWYKKKDRYGFYGFDGIPISGQMDTVWGAVSMALKQDTIIIGWGGDYFWMIKLSKETEEYNGVGTSKKEYTLKTEASDLKITYDFFKEPDQLKISDQNGNEIYHTDMTATEGKRVITIPLNGVKKITFNIASEEMSSKWWFKAEIQ